MRYRYLCLVLSAEKLEPAVYIKYPITLEIYSGLPSCCFSCYRSPLRFPQWVDLRFGKGIKGKPSQTGSVQIHASYVLPIRYHRPITVLSDLNSVVLCLVSGVVFSCHHIFPFPIPCVRIHDHREGSSISGSAMSVERGRSAAARHSYSTAAASAGRVRTNERLRPGTVALRVQALNQNLQAHHFQPSSGPEPNLPEASDQPTGRLSQGESLPDLFRSSDVQAESVGRYSTSNGEPFLPRGTRSSFGKRTGGGWAPPAGRRSTLHDTSAQPAEWARSVKAAGSRMNLPDGDNPGRPSVSRSERGDASTSIPQSSIRGMGGPGYNTARAYSRSNGLQYFPEHPEGGIASHSAQRSYKPVTPAANHGIYASSDTTHEHLLINSAPRGPSGMVSQIALPHGLPTASWDAPSAIPSPLTSGRAGGPPQNSLRQHIDSARHPNTWKHTNTAYSPIVGQPSPSIAQVMQGQRKNMSLLTSTRSEAGAPRISDAPLMWSPESYDSNDQTTGNSEPFPGFAGHQVSMESLDALGRQQGRPFSFNSDIEEELSTVRHSSQVEGQRLLRDSRKQSASQVSLETLLLQHRSSKEVTGAAATANGSGSRRSQATPKKTPSGLLSFIPRLLGRNESQPYDDLEEGRREDDPPGPRRSKELRTALDRDMLRIPAAPGLFEPEAPSMGYNRPSSVFVDARRGFAQAVSPYTAMQDAPPVEPEAPFRVGELGDQLRFFYYLPSP